MDVSTWALWIAAALLAAGAAALFVLRRRLSLPALLFNLLFPLLLLVLLESVLALAVRFPRFPAPEWLLGLERKAYQDQRRTIQYERACARYDEGLTYTLRPGHCTFANDEFSVGVDVNRLGVRDDEASLEAPEVVVVGDSFAMGWGVEQNETFAQQLEARTRLRVLDAAVSSYGTARELSMLGRIDTSRLRLLVIQYCRDNDYDENRSALEHGGRLPILPRETYEAIVDTPVQRPGYWFGKHVYRLLRELLGARPPWEEKLRSRGEAAPERVDAATEARAFLELLARAPVDLSHVQIVVLDLDGWGHLDDDFLDAVDALVAKGELPRPGAGLRTLRLRHDLNARRHFYCLDDHLNAAGHRVVSDALVELLPELGIQPNAAR